MLRTTLFVACIMIYTCIGFPFLMAQTNTPPWESQEKSFPAFVQFTPIPSGKGWNSDKQPLTDNVVKETLDNIIEHGFSGIYYPISGLSKEQNLKILSYAQSLGMKVHFSTNGMEMFGRSAPPPVSVYSPGYSEQVRKQVQIDLAPMKTIKNVYSMFAFQDEPFHADLSSLDYSDETRLEFRKRYGYDMPMIGIESNGIWQEQEILVRRDPKQWLDLLNFQSNIFRDGWEQVYKIVKEFDPAVKVVMTHDSHGTFGAGVKSNSKTAMDDIFHWGGDFADIFVYDIYPYMGNDFRYGEFGKFMKPRMSQLHYTMSQLRNLTTTYGKELGFWVGTYNKAWFKDYICPEREAQYWAEREQAFTAVAHGANLLITGWGIPESAKHWEDFGKGMKIIQKAGPALLKMSKVKAKACFLFPRTQCLQLQEEYFNVGITFELLMRAFGELDIIHEDQIVDDGLNGYKVLIIGDVKLLPEKVAKHVERFVNNGGIVLADCVPQMNAYRQPLDIMLNLFGVSSASSDIILQDGVWIPHVNQPEMYFKTVPEPIQSEIKTDLLSGNFNGQDYLLKIVSPRPATLSSGKVLLQLQSGLPALIQNKIGAGRTYLLGFSLQDTYFKSWKDNDTLSRDQLHLLLENIFRDANVYAHIHSSNPDIEATVRADAREGYVFIINHEVSDPISTILLADLELTVGKITDIETGKPVNFQKSGNGVEFKISAGFGETRLLKISDRDNSTRVESEVP